MPLFQEIGAGQRICGVLEWRHENDSAASYPGGAGYGSGADPPHALEGWGQMPNRPAKSAHWGAAGKMPERKAMKNH